MTPLPTETWFAAWRRCSSRSSSSGSTLCRRRSAATRSSAAEAPGPWSRSSWSSRTTKAVDSTSPGGSSIAGTSFATVPSCCDASRCFVGPLVGPAAARAAAEHLVGQPPEVLEQDEPEHRRHGPELADRQRGDRLERVDEPGDPRLVEPAVGVRHQGQRQREDAGVSLERLDGQLGQLGVVARGQVLLDLAEDVVDDVEVVDEPLGVEPAALAAVEAGEDLLVGLRERHPVLGEPLQERAVPPRRRGQAARRGQPAGVLLEVLDPQQLGEDRRLAPGVDQRRRRLAPWLRCRGRPSHRRHAHPGDFLLTRRGGGRRDPPRGPRPSPLRRQSAPEPRRLASL